jgi:transcriptional regulator with XRE-family HTH domain
MYRSNLKFSRELKGLSQSQLAKLSGVSLRNIQAYEQGTRDINEAQCIKVVQLAEALDCDIYDILNPRA